MDKAQDTSAHAVMLSPRRGVVTGLVYLFEQVMPDPFVLSSSIAPSQASHGNALNLVEKATGQIIPLSQTVFAPFVFIPTVLVVVVMTAIFIKMHPGPDQVVVFRARSSSRSSSTPPRSG